MSVRRDAGVTTAGARAQAQARRIEWPTILVAIMIHVAWLALTMLHARLPFWMLVACGGWIVAWHGSLQHETIHGHPTRWRWLNGVMASLPLALWLPYRCYRRDHLIHHSAECVTHPTLDPESRYLLRSRTRMGRLRHGVARVQGSLTGRLLLGPAITMIGFVAGEGRRAARRPMAVTRDWIPHLIGVAIVIGWLNRGGLGLGAYLAAFVYPGMALSLLRSFAEHRAAEHPGHRVAIVERGGALGLLYLNNHLHAAHHRAPHLAWFRLPAYYRRHRADLVEENGGLVYRSYADVVRRFAFRAHDTSIHPLLG